MMGGNEEIGKKPDLQQVEKYLNSQGERAEYSIDITVFPLSGIKKLLKYKDIRSVIAWCRKNGVFVIQQGNAHFVNRTQFELAFFKPFIEYLKANFENWYEQFTDYLGANYSRLLENGKRRTSEKTVNTGYTPQSNIEKSFLNKIKSV